MTVTGEQRSFHRIAGACAIVSAPIAWACLVLGAAAGGFDEAAFADPAVALDLGDPALARLSWICDVLGFYLLIVPSTLALREWIGGRWGDLLATAGLAYSILGACGAAIHAGADPFLIQRYDGANEAERATLVALRLLIEAVVNFGIWQYGSMICATVFWGGSGALLVGRRRGLGGLALLLGAVCLGVPLGGMIGVEAVFAGALMVYFLLAPVFAIVLGIQLLRE